MFAVVKQIHSLGRLSQNLAGYSGPTIGPKTATANKREFTEQQMLDAKAATTFLGKGSAGTPAESISKLTIGNTQVRTFGLEKEGLGVGGEVTSIGQGSTGTAAEGMSTAELSGRQINKNVAATAGLGQGGEATLIGGAANIK